MSDWKDLTTSLSNATQEQKQRLTMLYEELNRTQLQLTRLEKSVLPSFSSQWPGMIAELHQQRELLTRKINDLTADIASIINLKH